MIYIIDFKKIQMLVAAVKRALDQGQVLPLPLNLDWRAWDGWSKGMQMPEIQFHLVRNEMKKWNVLMNEIFLLFIIDFNRESQHRTSRFDNKFEMRRFRSKLCLA